jgi:hypothetical protein
MHDPLVVAFEIRRPWPRGRLGAGKRYFPAIVTVWHREPGGHDAGEVCEHFRRVFDEGERAWRRTPVNGWRFHVWHWKIQVHALQALRRSLLTRCAWCGGRSRKGDYTNISHSWDGPRGRWWRGEPGLFHHDCSAVQHAHAKCLCDEPALSHGDYGTCTACGGFRAWHQEPDEADWLLAAIPQGGRITPEARPAIEAVWAERRARKSADVT